MRMQWDCGCSGTAYGYDDVGDHITLEKKRKENRKRKKKKKRKEKRGIMGISSF